MNLTDGRISDAAEELLRSSNEGDLLLVYFSGHGVNVDGENYLISNSAVPLSTHTKDPARVFVKKYGISVTTLRMKLTAKDRTVVIFVDACRSASIPTKGAGSEGYTPLMRAIVDEESSTFGMQRILSQGSTYYGFASQPGTVAFDDYALEGAEMAGMSPFAAALKKQIIAYGRSEDLDIIFRLVRAQVAEAVQYTGHSQIPWSSHSLIRPLFLGCTPAFEPCSGAAGTISP